MMRWWIGTRLHELFPLIPFGKNTHHQVVFRRNITSKQSPPH